MDCWLACWFSKSALDQSGKGLLSLQACVGVTWKVHMSLYVGLTSLSQRFQGFSGLAIWTNSSRAYLKIKIIPTWPCTRQHWIFICDVYFCHIALTVVWCHSSGFSVSLLPSVELVVGMWTYLPWLGSCWLFPHMLLIFCAIIMLMMLCQCLQ